MDSLPLPGILSAAMQNRDLSISAGRAGAVRPAGTRPLPDGGVPRAAARQDHAPHDLAAAADRLERLLGQDGEAGNGARPGVPRRGFYINVLV